MNKFSFFPAFNPIRRIAQIIDRSFEISEYGFNNLYPQEMHQILLRSPLVKASVGVLSDFINGSGFAGSNSEVIVNENGQNINDVLFHASHDFAEYNGFALKIDLNSLGGAETVENIPFEFCRFGLPDELGKHKDIKVSNNWEQFSDELPQGSLLTPIEFPLFNPITNLDAGLSGKSVVLYYTGNVNPHEYSLTSFDSISNTAIADADIQQFELNSIANGFHGLTVFKFPSTFEEGEKEDLYAQLKQATGVGGQGIFVVQTDNVDVQTLLESVPAENSDALFLNTINAIRERVTQNYAMPPVLLGISAGGSVFNEQALIDGYIIYNTRTENRRRLIERVFNSFGDFGEITPQSILKSETITPEEESTEVIETEPAPQIEEEPTPEENAA